MVWNYVLPWNLVEYFGYSCKLYNTQKQPSRGALRKSVLKICSKFTGEHPCRCLISIKLLCNFIEIALRHGCSPANLLHIYRTPFLRTPLDGCFIILDFELFCSNLSCMTCNFCKTASIRSCSSSNDLLKGFLLVISNTHCSSWINWLSHPVTYLLPPLT